jgi:phosphate starvation-inducible membrane PsiE
MVVITTSNTYICGHLYIDKKHIYLWSFVHRQVIHISVVIQMTTDICVACRNHNHVLSSFVYVQMTTDICVTCRNHSHVLSSFVYIQMTTDICITLRQVTHISVVICT